MVNKAVLLMLAIIVGNISCKSDYVPPKQPPVVTDTEMCGKAEENLKVLVQQDKDPDGDCAYLLKPGVRTQDSFELFCKNTQSEGGVFLNPRCISEIKHCSLLDCCTQTKSDEECKKLNDKWSK